MEKKVLGLTDIEDLSWLASELVWRLLMESVFIDSEGNYIGYDEKRVSRFIEEEETRTNPQFMYLNFRECKELRELSFSDVEGLSVENIKQKYLFASLPMARKSFREDNIALTGLVAGPTIPDDYLDAIFCLAWKNDLRIWSLKWHEKCLVH